MEKYIHLIGTEQVQQAARTMRSAAQEMSQAANSISYTMENHQQFLDEWMGRFIEILERQEAQSK